jgi:hypothetical protein
VDKRSVSFWLLSGRSRAALVSAVSRGSLETQCQLRESNPYAVMMPMPPAVYCWHVWGRRAPPVFLVRSLWSSERSFSHNGQKSRYTL